MVDSKIDQVIANQNTPIGEETAAGDAILHLAVGECGAMVSTESPL